MPKTQAQIDWYNNWRKTPEGKAKMKICHQRWRKANPHKSRQYNLQHNYGISVDEWDQLFLAQGSKCAICKSDEPRAVNWHTDHCHKTNAIRGILCNWCNTALGKFQESPQIMNQAIGYLKEKYATK